MKAIFTVLASEKNSHFGKTSGTAQGSTAFVYYSTELHRIAEPAFMIYFTHVKVAKNYS
jgi:hypothetical protein